MLFDTIDTFRRVNMVRASLKKRFLPIDDDDGTTMLCYCEKGSNVPGQPSMVFIHGFSSNKQAWLSVIKVSEYLSLHIGKSLSMHRIFLTVITASQLIYLVTEKVSVLAKNNTWPLTLLIALNWYCTL